MVRERYLLTNYIGDVYTTDQKFGSTWNFAQFREFIVIAFKLHTYAKLNCLKKELFWHLNGVLMQNWTVWKRTVFDIEWDLR